SGNHRFRPRALNYWAVESNRGVLRTIAGKLRASLEGASVSTTVLSLTSNSWGILLNAGQDDVAIRLREIKLLINRWNMYEPIWPAPLRLSGCHFVKEHSISTSSGERNKT